MLERLEKNTDEQASTEAKAQLIERVNSCLHSGDYSRALDLLRDAAARFPNDPELPDLEKLGQDGVKRNAEAQRLITESQELFAQRKSAEAIQLLRKAYELDKNNSLARSILANALVEHAYSIVSTDWLEAEKLANQALNLNPAHPTAKTVLNLLVEQKESSSVQDWISQARKLQSAGDLFASLAWVAEGLAVHPHDPKLLQIQDEIQRDQEARRRLARRGDLDELRRLQREIDGAADVAAKQALAERIQGIAAKYWTDGEILSIANALLLRLGLISKENSSGSQRSKGAAVILHVPRPSPPKAAAAAAASPVVPSPAPQIPVPASPVAGNTPTLSASVSEVVPSPIPPVTAPTVVVPPKAPPILVPVVDTPAVVLPPKVAPAPAPPPKVRAGNTPAVTVPASKVPLRMPPRNRARIASPEPQAAPPPSAPIPPAEPSAPATKVTPRLSQPKQREKSNSTTLILVSVAAVILVGLTFFLTRDHYASPVAKSPSAVPAVSETTASAPAASAPETGAAVLAPPAPAPAQSTSEASLPASPSTDTGAASVALDNHPPTESARDAGSLVVVAGQDGAKVFINGRLQRQLTQAGQLSLPNLAPKDYVVQVSKSGFQDVPLQKIRIRKGEQTRLIFSLQPSPQPQPRLASLTVQGGAPGTGVFIDQTSVGSVQPDGTLSVSNVSPGDHTVELRRERFKPRQFKEHFVAGGAISLAAADAALEAAPSQLTIRYTPADAKVAVVKGDLLKMVSSGVPLNLAPGTYTLTARTAERFTRSSTIEVVAGQSRNLDLSLAPGGMSKWDDPGAWKPEKDSFIHKGGDFVLYGAVPAAGTFVFSAMPVKGHLLQWVVNYTDSKNYILFQMDDNSFQRTVVRNGQKADEIKVPDKGDKKSFRALQIRVSSTEVVHLIQHGESWTVLDRWTQFGANLSKGKFGFYIPGDDQVALSGFAHYADLTIR